MELEPQSPHLHNDDFVLLPHNYCVQLRGPPARRNTARNQNAARVNCNAWFGGAAADGDRIQPDRLDGNGIPTTAAPGLPGPSVLFRNSTIFHDDADPGRWFFPNVILVGRFA